MNLKILKGFDSFILFGAHQMGNMALKQLKEKGVNVTHFCDNDKNKWGTEINGLPVLCPDTLFEFTKENNALVIITSTFAKHVIASQLDELGVRYVYFAKPVFMELTSFCNQSCTFCPIEYIDRKKQNLDWEVAKSFLHDLASDKSDVVFPTVYPHVLGEPFLSRHLYDFLDTCKELGFYAVIVTNFTMIDDSVCKRLFENYPNLDIVLSIQGPTESVFHWRGEKKLSYNEWIDRVFEVIEAKFKYGHKGLVQLCTIWPNVANEVLIRSDEDLHIFEWFNSREEFVEWKRSFGQRCVDIAEKIKKQYPQQYQELSGVENPIMYYYNVNWMIEDLQEWIETDGPAQFGFLPDVHIYGKLFGLWGVDNYFKSLIPKTSYFYWEENWHAMSEKCDRVGDMSLLSSGQLVMCNIDNEADYVFAELSKGEKYTDATTQDRIRQLRNNLSLAPLCRKCKSRALVFDTTDIDCTTQQVIHYGLRWHRKTVDAQNAEYRVSYEMSHAFVYPRIDAKYLTVELASVQQKKQFTIIKLSTHCSKTNLFNEKLVYSLQLKPGERTTVKLPFEFERKLYRIEFVTATQRDNDIDNGVAVYNIAIANKQE